MIEVIALRDSLMNELNAGVFDLVSWQACAQMARDSGCENIAAQVDRYTAHYSGASAALD